MRTAATVVGISWMDAVLHTTSMHKLSLATPGVRRLIRRAASSPRGVAALPSPSRLAETLAAMVSMVPRSPAKSGNSRRRMGRSRRASFSASPARCMTSITPIHRQRTPAMEIPSSMADAAPSSAADASSPWLPIARAQSRESAVIPVQITVIAMVSPPRCPPSAPGCSRSTLCVFRKNHSFPYFPLFSWKRQVSIDFLPHFVIIKLNP